MKSYGQHIKAPAATVRHRLYETLSLIPPHAFEGKLCGSTSKRSKTTDNFLKINDYAFVGSYTHVLRLLVSEFTLGENPANTTCSVLRSACHTDDSVLLSASPLLHSDHHIVEDQVADKFAIIFVDSRLVTLFFRIIRT